MRALTPTSSPLSSPSKHGDRYIPSRAGANWSVNFHRINVSLLRRSQNGAVSPVRRTVFRVDADWWEKRTWHHVSFFLSFSSFFLGILIYPCLCCRKLKSLTIRTGRRKMAQQTATKVIHLLLCQKASAKTVDMSIELVLCTQPVQSYTIDFCMYLFLC